MPDHTLERLLRSNPRFAVGLMSGTSLDGVDAALVEIHNSGVDTRVELLHFVTHPYPAGLKETLLQISASDGGSTGELCRLNFLLGHLFADAVQALLQAAHFDPARLHFIASHGQTVQHLPQPETRFGYEVTGTLQIAEPSVIAKRTGVPTVADFRPADMAEGGQGAPLVPYFDYLLFHSADTNRGLLNLGGIANLTVLPKEAGLDQNTAFDTGPGNMVIDTVTAELFGQPYDRDGALAATGTVSEKLLRFGLKHPYFERRPPKSTGREEFGAEFSRRFVRQGRRLGLRPEDVVATATELTAATVHQAYADFVEKETPLDELIVSGGGARNGVLMQSLQEKFSLPVRPIDEFGIPAEAKEAVCFAVLGNETLAGHPNNVPAATGARRATVLGKICL